MNSGAYGIYSVTFTINIDSFSNPTSSSYMQALVYQQTTPFTNKNIPASSAVLVTEELITSNNGHQSLTVTGLLNYDKSDNRYFGFAINAVGNNQSVFSNTPIYAYITVYKVA
jgi:hypothetical protein